MDTFAKTVLCPHCGHHVHFSFDTTNGDQNYYEECPACCNDIHIDMHLDDIQQKVEVRLDADDEQIY